MKPSITASDGIVPVAKSPYARDWRTNYGFLDSFWEEVIAKRKDRKWLIVVLHDGPLFPRDAFAFWRLSARLRDREDIKFRFVRAFDPHGDPIELDNYDLLFVGRPRPVDHPSLAPYAKFLERNLTGKFRESPHGTNSDSVWYGGSRFRRHELQVSSDAPGQYDVDMDYGILAWRRHDDRQLVTIAGITTLGTLGLVLILTDDQHRKKLYNDARTFAPWEPQLRPQEAGEICVRIDVGPERLPKFLNETQFDFRVEAVAIEGGATRVRTASEASFKLNMHESGRATIEFDNLDRARLPRCQALLLAWIVEHPNQASVAQILAGLKRSEGGVTKNMHDLKKNLARQIPALDTHRFIRHDKKGDRYVLGATGRVVRGEPA